MPDAKMVFDFINKAVEISRNSLRSIASIVVAIVVIAVISLGTTLAADYLRRSSEIKKSELQSKLLWNNIGQCFYAELDDFNKYYKIVRVEDCDKTK